MTRRASKGGNGNHRGSAAERRALKTWMLSEFGDGISCLCAFCGKVLLYSTMTKDRFPIPGRDGGKYVKGNVRPACMSCNARDGREWSKTHREELKARRVAYANV